MPKTNDLIPFLVVADAAAAAGKCIFIELYFFSSSIRTYGSYENNQKYLAVNENPVAAVTTAFNLFKCVSFLLFICFSLAVCYSICVSILEFLCMRESVVASFSLVDFA